MHPLRDLFSPRYRRRTLVNSALFGTGLLSLGTILGCVLGRLIGAGVNFLLALLVQRTGTLGTPVAYTAVAFAMGLPVILLAVETRGQPLPD